MPTLGAIQVEEPIAIRTAHVLALFIATDRAMSVARDLTGETVYLRFGPGSGLAHKEYTALNRTQSGATKGYADVTLDETYHTEAGDFDAGIFLDVGNGKPFLVPPQRTIAFVTNYYPTPTPTPTPTP